MKFEMPQVTPELIIDIVIRRRWFIMVPLSLALFVGIYLSVVLPKIYEASTLILVERQSVPQNIVQPIVTDDLSSRISTITQQIMSRTNLEKIINDFNLFGSRMSGNRYMEDLLEDLRKDISVQVMGKGGAFSVSFKNSDPKKAMMVTNALASSFIDENLKVRELQSIGTSDFLDSELEISRRKLEEIENSILNYRKNNMGELPDQLQANLTILGRLQENLSERRQSLQNLKARLGELNRQASERMSSLAYIDEGQGNPQKGLNLQQLYAKLEELKIRYTERHPDIQRLKKQIAELEAKRNSLPTDNKTPRGTPAGIDGELKQQIDEIQREVNLTQAEIFDIESKIKEYQRRVENTPKKEQELQVLKRDYNNLKTSYSSLLSKKLEADIAVNMERKQKGEQFRVIDPAKEPQKPISPDMRKLFLKQIALAFAVSGVLIFLLEFAKPSFRKLEEIEAQYAIPVLVAIPQLLDNRQILKRKIDMGLSIGYLVSIVGLIGVACLIIIKGSEFIIALF